MIMTFGSRLNLLLEKVKGLVSGQPKKEKKERTSGCPHHFGYLGNRPKNASVPQECLTCQKMLECRNISS